MADIYIERDCIWTHEGRGYEAGGAIVTPDHIIAYPAADGVLCDWHGAVLGTWRATSTWKLPRSWMSATMSAITARVGGVTYKGRGCGVGMIYRGKRSAVA
jgi:hypothetical protein